MIREVQEEQSGGVYLPDGADEYYPLRGEVLAVGEDTEEMKCPVRKGDKVVFRRFGVQTVREGSEELKLARFEDIFATYG